MSDISTVLIIFLIAMAFSLAGVPFVRRFARKLGFFDQPNARNLHHTPTPLMGGVAIFIAVVAAVLLFGQHYLSQLLGILAAISSAALVGLLDDRYHLRASVKLGSQLVIACGLFLIGIQVHLGWLPPWVNFILTVGWLVGITNAMNLLDNMDGLSGGVAAVAAAFLTVIAAMNGQFLALFGGCLGFLCFNTRPASIFMGDSGSLFIGLLLAILAIKLRFPGNSNFVTWMVPVLVMGVPIFDTTLVIVSRLRRGKNPMTTPGKDHLSHRLVARGLTQLEAVLLLYLAGAGFGLLALFITQASIPEGYLVCVSVLAVGGWFLWRLDDGFSEQG
jgi:UDP-GlcNAc:undecaprenyl-phosphate GlcNAc-1-phosphate transferase